MSNSPLVEFVRISPNRSSPRKAPIDTITIHCVVGQATVERIGEIFAPKDAQKSSNYGIGRDGKIGLYVAEEDRSWCSSNRNNDNRAITIECASDSRPPYAINDQVYASLVRLCSDICRRNGIPELKWKADKSLIGQVDQQNLTVHRWFYPKECPGEYIYQRLGKIASDVNALLQSNTTPHAPEVVEIVTDVKTPPFVEKIGAPDLKIFTGPGEEYAARKKPTGIGYFTIVDVVYVDNVKWGLLKTYKKNRDGWIRLN